MSLLQDIVTNCVSPTTVTPPPAATSTELDSLKKVIDTFIADANKKLTTGPTGPMGLIEVTSLLQLPIILEKLQNSPESIRLNFPPDANGQVTNEQKNIHQLLSDRHSKSLGDLTNEALNLLAGSAILKGLATDVKDGALQYLFDKVKPDPNHASTLQVNHIIDASQPGADLKKLADQLVQGVKQGSNKGGFILQVPAQGSMECFQKALALVEHIGPLLDNNEQAQANLANGTIWLGDSQVWETSSTLPNRIENFDVLSFEDLWNKYTANQELLKQRAQAEAEAAAAAPSAEPEVQDKVDETFLDTAEVPNPSESVVETIVDSTDTPSPSNEAEADTEASSEEGLPAVILGTENEPLPRTEKEPQDSLIDRILRVANQKLP
jgi:hypothetical protein